MGCDLLIHEATFHDDKSEDAQKKKHCTVSEATQISLQMKAKHTILTHFSQRYPNTIVKDVDSSKTISSGKEEDNSTNQSVNGRFDGLDVKRLSASDNFGNNFRMRKSAKGGEQFSHPSHLGQNRSSPFASPNSGGYNYY